MSNNIKSATLADPAGNAAGDITAITDTPSVAGPLGVGATVTFTLTVSQPVTVNGVSGFSFLTLNDGGVADFDSIDPTGMSLTFTYVVGGGDNTDDLQVTGLDLNGDNGGAITVPGSLAFFSPVSYDAGTTPVSVTTADVNGDGIPDLIVADQGSGNDEGGVSVLLGIGGGGFSLPTTYPAVPYPDAVTTADINGDGKTDLIVTGPLGTVAVQLGNGSGGFSAPTTYAAGPDPVSVTTADLNDDGKLDLIITDFNGGVSVLLGNGSGGFSAPSTYAAGANPTSVTTADLTGDGNTDLIVSDAGGVAVLMRDISGGFSAPITYTVGTDPDFVTTADVNGDGKLDLVVADADGSVEVLLGDGNGTFSAPTTFDAGPGPTSVTTADVNGDGKLDLIVADAFGGVSVLLGDGSGGFSAPTTFDAGLKPPSVTTADLNGDGLPDLIVADSRGGVSVLLNDSTAPGTFDPTITAATSGADTGLVVDTTPPNVVGVTASPSAGTFGAGAVITLSVAMSAIVSVSGGAPSLTLNDGGVATYVSGSGTSTLVFATTVAAGQSTADLAVIGFVPNGAVVRDLAGNVADLDGTFPALPGTISIGTPDVVITAITATPSVPGPLDAGDTVTFTVAVSQPVSVTGIPVLSLNVPGTAIYTGGAASTTSLVFTYTVAKGDSTSDLAVTGLELDGAAIAVPGSFGLAAATTYAAGPDPVSVTTADVNGDGIPDLIVADKDGGVSVLRGNGSGGFLPATTYAAGTDPTSVTTADLTGDGKSDLIVADASGSVAVLLPDASGGFSTPTTYAAGPDPVSVTTADLNGDGTPDLIVADNGGGVSVLLGNGSGGFSAATKYATGTNPESVTTADVNDDGKLDLVVADQGGVSVLLGAGNGRFSPPTTYAAGLNPVSVTTADVNGDGSPDIIVADPNSGITVLPGPLVNGGTPGDGLVNGGQMPFSVATYQFAGDGGAINPTETLSDVPGYGTLTVSFGPYFEGQTTNDPSSIPISVGGQPTPSSPLALTTDPDPELQTIVESDQSAPTPGTEVLGGGPVGVTGAFGGPIAILFSTPVSGVTLTGGDFDAPKSVNIEAYSATGDSLGYVTNLDYGYETFNLSDGGAPNIAGLLITSNDGGGFGIDDLGVAALPGGTTYAAGPAPVAVTTADLNGDGIPDLIAVDSGGVGGVSVLLGQPGGGYSAPVTYAAGPAPVSVTVTDVNGDGKPDLIVADQNGGVSVLLNNTTAPGTFDPDSAKTASGADAKLVVDTTPPTITGTKANQTTTNQTPIRVFAGVAITDAFNGGNEVDTLSISYNGPGTLSGSGLLGGPGDYSLTGTATAITTALRALSFTPVDLVPNTSVGTTFTLSDSSPAYPTAVTDSTTSLTDNDPAVAISINGVVTNTATIGHAQTLVPFSGVSIIDPNAAESETATITLINVNAGTLAFAAGTNTGLSLSRSGNVYTIKAGTAAAVDAAIDALVFTPAAPTVASGTAFDLTVTDTTGKSAVLNTGTIAIDPGPVVTGSVTSNVSLGGSIDLTSAILGAARGGLAGDTLTITADSTAATLGKVILVNGDLVYDAVGTGLENISANGTQTDTFGYTISDSHGDTTNGTATVTVKNPGHVINGPPYGFATIEGTSGADIINAFGYFNRIYGNGGNDVINAGLGGATVYTSGGNVVTNLSGYFNAVRGGDGNNTVSGAQGSTTVTLGNGNDSISIGGYFDLITLGNGNNTITGPQGSTCVTVGNGADTITLAGYNNFVHAGSTTGTDMINAGAGAETVTGGNGNFSVNAGGYSDTVTLGNGTDSVTGMLGLASITTGAGNDTIVLSGYGNTVNAGGGNNAITGGSGNDMFFLPTPGGGNFDTITHFTTGNDDVLNLAAALTAAGWNSHGTLANYLKVSESGGNATIAVANGGTGAGTAIAELVGVGNLTLPILQQHAVL